MTTKWYKTTASEKTKINGKEIHFKLTIDQKTGPSA